MTYTFVTKVEITDIKIRVPQKYDEFRGSRTTAVGSCSKELEWLICVMKGIRYVDESYLCHLLGRYLTEKVVPGNRVTVIGIYSIKKAVASKVGKEQDDRF